MIIVCQILKHFKVLASAFMFLEKFYCVKNASKVVQMPVCHQNAVDFNICVL